MDHARQEHDRSKRAVAERLGRLLTDRLGATAVAIGGSMATGASDAGSDIDLYVYADPTPSVARRAAVATEFGAAAGAEIGNTFFEPGDEWRHAETGVDVDIMYRTPESIEGKLDALLVRHEASLGYSTCFWHNIRTSHALADPHGWFAGLQRRAAADYPQALVHSIIRLNWAMLAVTKNCWLAQLGSALERRDAVSAGHRTSAFLASYFDVLFAVNRQPHPGEKRLLSFANNLCELRPAGLDEEVMLLLRTSGQGDPAAKAHAATLLEGLEPLAAGALDRS